LTITVTLRLTT
nr:immunoglobulin light chain junction region [Homo sapiens]